VSEPLTAADVVLAIALIVACITDLRSQKIYNALTFPLMLTGVGIWLVKGDVLFALTGLGAAFVLHFALFALRVDRAGDAKLMMGVGACWGWVEMLEASLWAFLVFAPMGLVVLIATRRLSRFVAALRWTWLRVTTGAEIAGDRPEGTPLAKAPAIAIGVVIARLTQLIYLTPPAQ